jgi:hypothetical protein
LDKLSIIYNEIGVYKMKRLFSIFLVFFMVSGFAAADVAFVIDDGSDVSTKCLTVEDGASMELICSQPGNSCDYSWGSPFITRLDGVDCSSGGMCEDPVWGDYPRYWSIYVDGSFSMVGISDIAARDGMVLGFRCGCGEAPSATPGFCEICKCTGGRRAPKIMGYAIYSPKENEVSEALVKGEPFEIKLFDNKTGHPIGYADVEVFDNLWAIGAPLASGKTNRDGRVSLTVEDAGDHIIRIAGSQYPHKYIEASFSQETTTTLPQTTTLAASTTVTTLSQTTTTTTTLNLPKHLDFKDLKDEASENPDENPNPPKAVGLAAYEVEPAKDLGLLGWFLNLLGL